MSQKLWGGIDIGGTKTAVVLANTPPNILARAVFPTEPENGPEPALRRIIQCLNELLRAHGFSAQDLAAIGISCGGPLDPVRGLIKSPPNLASWKDVAITNILRKEFGVPCSLENDANAGALAEHQFGAGGDCENMIFLTFGTGLGAGLILGGRLYRGSSFASGEIGHVRLSRKGPVGFCKIGSAEGWASGGGISQLAATVVRAAEKRGVKTLLNAAQPITAIQLWEAARQEDRIAIEVIRKSGKKLGEAIAILVDLFNPECIAVGGLAMRMGEAVLKPARDMARLESLPDSFQGCKIVSAALGESIGDVAALCVAMEGVN